MDELFWKSSFKAKMVEQKSLYMFIMDHLHLFDGGTDKDFTVNMEEMHVSRSTWKKCRLSLHYKMTDAVGEILNGLRSYFDKALPVILLYKKERLQYQEAVSDNTSPSTIYGAEHLLRLFVKLPEFLAYVKIDEETSIRLQQRVIEFLKFLQSSESNFFLSAYDGPKVSEGGSKGKDS